MRKRSWGGIILFALIMLGGCNRELLLEQQPPADISEHKIYPTEQWLTPNTGIYSSGDLNRDVARLAREYPRAVSIQEIGQSAQGRTLWALKLGHGKKEIMINAAHHGREWLTTFLVMRQLETYALAYELEEKVGDFEVRRLLDRVSIWFVPMVNPDGVSLSQNGLESINNEELVRILAELNEGNNDVSGWKANIRGIDLNRQYDVNWRKLPTLAGPAPSDYKGKRSVSEPETQALVRFTLAHQFQTTVSYHSSGSVIYWYFKQKNKRLTERDYQLAEELATLTGYELIPPDPFEVVGGGYKDWFINTFHRPSFTVEIGKTVDKKPLKWEEYPQIWEENRYLPLYLAEQFK